MLTPRGLICINFEIKQKQILTKYNKLRGRTKCHIVLIDIVAQRR